MLATIPATLAASVACGRFSTAYNAVRPRGSPAVLAAFGGASRHLRLPGAYDCEAVSMTTRPICVGFTLVNGQLVLGPVKVACSAWWRRKALELSNAA